jgi:hypothetical protein
MKKLLSILTLSLFLTAHSQEPEKITYDKTVTFYNSFSDYQSKKGIPAGEYKSFAWSSFGTNSLQVVVNGKEKMENLNKYWGFTVGDFLFRSKQNGKRIPVVVVNANSKVYYIDGYIYLDMIRGESNAGSSTRSWDAVFYSDDFEGDIFEITKFISREKDNPELASMVDCIKKGKKRRGLQAQFNSYFDCITQD